MSGSMTPPMPPATTPPAATPPPTGPVANPQNFVCPVGVNTSRPLLNQRLEALILAIGTDISSLAKAAADDRLSVAGQIAASQAQIEAEIAALVSPINDAATSGTTVTWSVDQIKLYVSQQIAMVTQITPSQLTMLLALAAEVNSDTGAIAAIMAILAKTVRVDMVQVFTDAEKAQARANIGAVSASDVSVLIMNAIPEPMLEFADEDLARFYYNVRFCAS